MRVSWCIVLLLAGVLGSAEEVPLEEGIEPSTTTAKPPDEKCFQPPPSLCPTDICRCRRLEEETDIICCHVQSLYLLKEGLGCVNANITNVKRIHIYNATLDVFNISLVQPYIKGVKSMSVTDGRIGRVINEFSRGHALTCLNFSNNAIEKIDKRPFVYLQNLSMLDLSHNNLSEVPNFKKKQIINLDISNNTPLMCRSLMEAMNNKELHFVRDSETFCLFPKTFHWFNTTELIPLRQVRTYNDQENKTCGDNCTCRAQRLDFVQGKPPTFAVMVDCSGKQLTEMPTNLPANTIGLNVSNNNISELKMDSAIYENIRELYADNNQITSILSLEGTTFITNFVALSLRNNKLKSLPIYMLSNIFDRNSISRNVSLGLNRLQCDCITAKTLRVWLNAKQKNIPDYNEIMCENNDLQVIKLDPLKMCQQPYQQDWTDYIYYIITAEVLLLLCLILKVSYDYWVFKTMGYLPWPASKMPKLPCDWLCE